MQNLVLNGGDQRLKLLRLCADAVRAEIGVSGNGTVQQGLLLTVRRIGNRQPFEAALGLTGRDVEHEVGVFYSIPRLCAAVDPTVLARGIADSADL